MYTTVLNWLLGINFFTYVFKNELPLNIPISAFLITTFLLLTFELIHFSINLIRDKPRHDAFYRGLNSGDVWRLLSALAIANWLSASVTANWPSANSTYILSMLLFVIVAFIAAISVYLTCIGLLRKKYAKTVAVLGLASLYILCGWMLTLYISQYGTRELGHWLEMPRYTTVFPATMTTCSEQFTCRGDGEPAQAYVSVKNESDPNHNRGFLSYVARPNIRVLSFKITSTGEVHDNTSYLWALDMDSASGNPYGWVEDDLGRRWKISIEKHE